MIAFVFSAVWYNPTPDFKGRFVAVNDWINTLNTLTALLHHRLFFRMTLQNLTTSLKMRFRFSVRDVHYDHFVLAALALYCSCGVKTKEAVSLWLKCSFKGRFM